MIYLEDRKYIGVLFLIFVQYEVNVTKNCNSCKLISKYLFGIVIDCLLVMVEAKRYTHVNSSTADFAVAVLAGQSVIFIIAGC